MVAAMRSAALNNLGTVAPLTASEQDLLRSQDAAAAEARQFGPFGRLPFAPVLGRDPMPASDEVADRVALAAETIDLLIGYTKDDGEPFAIMEMATSAEPVVFDASRERLRLASAAMTQTVFANPALKLADIWPRCGGRVASYRVDWCPDDAPFGACHCIELPLLFDTAAWTDAPMLGTENDPVDHDLASEMRTCWARFAHAGTDALISRRFVFG